MKEIHKPDMLDINDWRKKRGLEILPDAFYSTYGVIEPGIAAAWLTMTDSKVALLENFITNPEADSETRKKALFDIADHLEEVAKDRGVAYLFGITHNTKLKDYAMKAGWADVGLCRLFVKNLAEE